MGTTIDSLDIQVSQSSSNAVKGIEDLAGSLEKLKSATKGGLGLTSIIRQLNSVVEPINRTNGASIRKLESLAGAIDKLSSAGKISPSIANNISKIGAAMDNITSEGVTRLQETVSALERMKDVGKISTPNLAKVTPAIASGDKTIAPRKAPIVGEPATPAPAKDVTQEIQRESAAVGNLTKKYGYFRTQATTAASTIKASYSEAFKRVKNSTGEAFSAIKRLGSIIANLPSQAIVKIATAPLKLISAFKSATNAVDNLRRKLVSVAGAKIKQGILNIGNAFKSLSPKIALANSKLGQFMKSIARIGMYRAIRALISGFTKAIKEGADNMYQFSKITDGAFAQSMDRCATSFQYLKNSLGAMIAPLINALAPAIDFVIDKIVALINVVNQLFARLSGATTFTMAKKQATEYAKSASEAASGTKKAAKEIKDATTGIDELNIISQNDNSSGGGGKDTPDFSEMFETAEINNEIKSFSDWIRMTFESENWDLLGRVLGNKFNSIVDTIPWGDIGTKIGHSFNAAISTLYSFLDHIDFRAIGNRAAELLNNALAEVDFSKVGGLWAKKFTTMLDTLIGFLEKLDWKLTGKSIGDFVRGAFDEGSKFIDKYKWGDMGHKAYEGLKNLIKGIDFASLAQSFFSFLGKAIAAAVSFIGTFLVDTWNDIATYFEGYITNDDGTKKTGWAIVSGIFDGIIDALVNVGKWIYDNVFVPFIDGFKSAFQIDVSAKSMKGIGKAIVDGVYDDIKAHINDGEEILKTWADNVYEWFAKGKDGKGLVENFKILARDIVSGFKDNIAASKKDVKDTITSWADDIKNWYTGDSEGAINARTFAEYARDTILGYNEEVATTSPSTQEKIYEWATGIKSWFTEHVNMENWRTYAADTITGFKEKIASTYTESKANIETWANNVKTWFSKIASKSAFATFANDVITGFKTKIGNAYTTVKENMVKFADSVKEWFSKPGKKTLVESFTEIGKNVIQGFIDGVNALWDAAMNKIRSFGESIISAGKAALGVHSPSRIFREIGGFTVEGFNLGLSDSMQSTFAIMGEWLGNLNSYQPRLAFAVDTSALDYYTARSYMSDIDTSVSSHATYTTEGFREGMEEFYRDYLEPTLSAIADDTKRQADKESHTIVNIGNRTITDAVEIQREADGYRFTR